MKTTYLKISTFVGAFLLWQAGAFAAIQVTVISTDIADAPNSELTLTEAVNWMNNPGYRALSNDESNQVATIAGTINYINFGITGAGPFVITDIPELEITAANVVVNGYSQSGSSPNTNPILAANNAVLKVVIKSTTGARAFTVHADNFWLRGVCLLYTRLAFDGEEYPNPGDFYAAYRQDWPLDPGYATRRTLYNLYHVINHFNLFGGGSSEKVPSQLFRKR